MGKGFAVGHDDTGPWDPGHRADMRVVSRFEANLLHLLHFFLRRAPAE
jgi:hypothetical protein